MNCSKCGNNKFAFHCLIDEDFENDDIEIDSLPIKVVEEKEMFNFVFSMLKCKNCGKETYVDTKASIEIYIIPEDDD